MGLTSRAGERYENLWGQREIQSLLIDQVLLLVQPKNYNGKCHLPCSPNLNNIESQTVDHTTCTKMDLFSGKSLWKLLFSIFKMGVVLT